MVKKRKKLADIIAEVEAETPAPLTPAPLYVTNRIAKLEMELARARKERDQLRTLVEVVLIAAPVVLDGIDDGR